MYEVSDAVSKRKINKQHFLFIIPKILTRTVTALTIDRHQSGLQIYMFDLHILTTYFLVIDLCGLIEVSFVDQIQPIVHKVEAADGVRCLILFVDREVTVSCIIAIHKMPTVN